MTGAAATKEGKPGASNGTLERHARGGELHTWAVAVAPRVTICGQRLTLKLSAPVAPRGARIPARRGSGLARADR